MKITEKKIGIIANPRAGKDYKEFGRVQKIARRKGIPFVITNRISEISNALIKLIKDDGINILAGYGGDGTLHKLIDFLLYKMLHEPEKGKRITQIPLLAALGGGTMNSVHYWLGMEGRPSHILQKIIDTPYEHLPTRKLRPLKVTFTRPKDGRERIHYGYMFVMGAINRIIEKYDLEGHTVASGLKYFTLSVLAGLTGLPAEYRRLLNQFDAEIWADDEKLAQTRPLSIIASVTNTFVFGAKPFHGQPETNQFRAASYQINAPTIGLMLPLIFRGTFVPGVTIFPRYSYISQIAPDMAAWLNRSWLSRKMPGAENFFNRPVFRFKIIPKTESNFNLDGESIPMLPGKPLTIELGPEVEFISAFGR